MFYSTNINQHCFKRNLNSCKTLVLAMMLSVSLFSCEDEPNLPTADFTFDNNQECPVVVKFTNTSENAISYIWEMGDGSYSSSENPQKRFYDPGRYTITLKAKNTEGSTKVSKTLTITGTTYRIYNATQYTLPGVVSFYYDEYEEEVYDFVGLGALDSGEQSSYVLTTRSEIRVGFESQDGQYIYYVSAPYAITTNKENILEIHEFTQVVVVSAGLRGAAYNKDASTYNLSDIIENRIELR